jgi:hypothetical protein
MAIASESDETRPVQQRFTPSSSQLAVLRPALIRFYSYPRRTPERKQVILDTLAALPASETGPQCNEKHLRIWFNNNKHTLQSHPATGTPIERLERKVDAMWGDIRDRMPPLPPRALIVRPPPLPPRDELPERIVDLIGGANLPVSLVEKEAFRVFLRETVQMHDLPSRSEIRNGILRRAEAYRSSIVPLGYG